MRKEESRVTFTRAVQAGRWEKNPNESGWTHKTLGEEHQRQTIDISFGGKKERRNMEQQFEGEVESTKVLLFFKMRQVRAYGCANENNLVSCKREGMELDREQWRLQPLPEAWSVHSIIEENQNTWSIDKDRQIDVVAGA